MAKQIKKSKEEIATIDCSLITIETEDGIELGFDTANQIGVEPQVEEEDAVKLIVKGILRAQKPKTTTITGHEITLTDNVFNPELVLVLQGGKIIYDTADPTKIIGYEPPIVGTPDKGEIFKLNAYTAQYDASGQIVKYEKITYPNCTGVPVAFGSEDGAFRAPEYTINSAPKKGQAPYSISYVDTLPVLVDEVIAELTATIRQGENNIYYVDSTVPAKTGSQSLHYSLAQSKEEADATYPELGDTVYGTNLNADGGFSSIIGQSSIKAKYVTVALKDPAKGMIAAGTFELS